MHAFGSLIREHMSRRPPPPAPGAGGGVLVLRRMKYDVAVHLRRGTELTRFCEVGGSNKIFS